MSLTTLREKLENVEVSYPEFVDSLMTDAELYGNGDLIEQFIDDNPGVNSGDVLEYEMKIIGLI